MEFRVDQVDLTEVGLTRVMRDSRAMLDRLAQMRITLHSSPGEEPDASLIRLGKGVRWAAAHGLNGSTHRVVSPSQGGRANFVLSLRKNEAARACFFLSLSQSLVVILEPLFDGCEV
jgi:hypothetical protein